MVQTSGIASNGDTIEAFDSHYSLIAEMADPSARYL